MISGFSKAIWQVTILFPFILNLLKYFYYHFYLFSPQILCAGHNSVRAGNTSIDKIMLVVLSLKELRV